jgi:hypothetical protein
MPVHRKCSIHARRNHLQERDGTGARGEQDDEACCSERSGISSPLSFDMSDDSKDGIAYRLRISDFMHQKVTYLWYG